MQSLCFFRNLWHGHSRITLTASFVPRRPLAFAPLMTFRRDRQTDDSILPPLCGCQTDDEREGGCDEEMRSWAGFDITAMERREAGRTEPADEMESGLSVSLNRAE